MGTISFTDIRKRIMIQSMTAFARHEGRGDWGSAVWELRSVNHRYLDINMRLPEMFFSLEPIVREHLRTKIQRGKIECQLRFRSAEENAIVLTLNKPFLEQVLKAKNEVSKMMGESTPST